MMDAVGRLGTYIGKSVVTVSGPFHPFGGAVDIIVVEQPDGSYKSSPWYVKFGKFQGVLKANEKIVTINVNGIDMNFHMYLNHRGEAYFLHKNNVEDAELQLGVENNQTCSNKSRILGLMFGRDSIKENSENDNSAWERAQLAADLLELKWSTNLYSRRRKDLPSPETPITSTDLMTSDRSGHENVVSKENMLDNFEHANELVKVDVDLPLEIDEDYISEKYKICDVQKVKNESLSNSSSVSASSAQVLTFRQFENKDGPNSVFTISSINNSTTLVQGSETTMKVEDGLQKLVGQSLLLNILESEISDEEQLLFGDFDDFSIDEDEIIEYLSQKEEEPQPENGLQEASFHEYGLHSRQCKEITNQIDLKNEVSLSKSLDSCTGSSNISPFTNRSDNIELPQVVDNNSVSSDADNNLKSPKGANEHKDVPSVKVANKKIRGLTPTSEQLATLHLKEGQNQVTFIFSTPMLGRQQVDARIFLWRWDTRIAISDVDGTITRSDVLGQLMPWVGVDWTHTGVTHLFTAIKENGYQLLFLSARAISQSYLTRQFLFNIKQDGKSLPDGPVIISPDGLFPSLFREVVRRAPHEFKIGCLEDIKALFPTDRNPFYAGFGNRDTDELSYLKVGIPLGKIFIINPKGEIVVNRHINKESYTSLHGLADDVFPPATSSEQVDQ